MGVIFGQTNQTPFDSSAYDILPEPLATSMKLNMKFILIFILTLINLFGFVLNILAQETSSNIDFQKESLKSDFEMATHFSLTEIIIADFNGDGNSDSAFYMKENKTSGIIIKHGQTKEKVRIGFGKNFSHLTEFNWVDFWGLVKDSTTYEIIFDETNTLNDTIIGLENPSIVVRKEESGGGLITFMKGEYKWIHQSD